MMYADLLLDNIPLDMKIKDRVVLSPNNMPFFRRKICADIRRGQLNYNNDQIPGIIYINTLFHTDMYIYVHTPTYMSIIIYLTPYIHK